MTPMQLTKADAFIAKAKDETTRAQINFEQATDELAKMGLTDEAAIEAEEAKLTAQLEALDRAVEQESAENIRILTEAGCVL